MKRILFSLALICSAASAAPLADLSGGQTGRIEFQSITMPSIWQYARRNLSETKATAIYGDLLLPPNASGKVPALLISHGSGGVSPYAFEVWVKQMNAAGVAVFVIDSFKPRGISETAQDQSILSPAAMVADALNGLRLLASHPKIDASRIYHIGFSRGGGIAFYTAWPMYQRPVQTNGAHFAGHIPVYPAGCDVRYRADTEHATAPIFMAAADRKDEDWVNSATCERFANELAAHGQPVTFKEYPGTYHGFDGKSQFFYYNNAQISKNCDMELQMTDVAGGGLGRNAKDFKTGKNLESFADWDAAYKSCSVNQRARIGGDSKQSAELVADVLKFMGVK